MKLAIFTSLFLLALVAGIHGTCLYTDGNGHTYNLSTLTRPSTGGTAGKLVWHILLIPFSILIVFFNF